MAAIQILLPVGFWYANGQGALFGFEGVHARRKPAVMAVRFCHQYEI